MGQILDIVPNHMSGESENPGGWMSSENGRSSPYAHFFDIDWNPAIKSSPANCTSLFSETNTARYSKVRN